jgi:hypothetical protein
MDDSDMISATASQAAPNSRGARTAASRASLHGL